MPDLKFKFDLKRPLDRQICEQLYEKIDDLNKEITNKLNEREELLVDDFNSLNCRELDSYMTNIAFALNDIRETEDLVEDLIETFKECHAKYSKHRKIFMEILLIIYLITSFIGLNVAPFLTTLMSILFLKINVDSLITMKKENKNITELNNAIQENLDRLDERHAKLFSEYLKSFNIKVKKEDACLDYYPKKSLNTYQIYPEFRKIAHNGGTMYVSESRYLEYCETCEQEFKVYPSNDKLTIAKHVLNTYLATGEILPMDMEVSYFVKVSLQHYLNSDLTNVEDLLKLYKENINGQGLKRRK